ncbi:MAG: TIGR00282 family metallophosphoesterase [Dehalococcoidia bacterium]|nr:TIGR00282 family metallophosphoesterase [Dehalococcoidia bacterium]
MRILVIGDVIGRPGRKAVRNLVPGLRHDLGLGLVIANAENAAGGKGLTPDTADELLDSGVDVLTSGNHIWAQKEVLPLLDSDVPILRPLNYAPGVPGRGYIRRKNVLIVNLVGRTFMGQADCPFRAINQLLEGLTEKPEAIVVDFHAEATSEKQAMGRYLDGRVAGVLGTHTHVGTIDARILPRGTAFVSDIGMVGPSDSVIGDSVDDVLRRFLTHMPQRLSVGKGPVTFNSVLVETEPSTGLSTRITRIDREVE